MSLPQKCHRPRGLYLETHAMDVHCDREMCDSATDSKATANQASQVVDAMEKGLGIPSAQLESMRITKMMPAQEKSRILPGLVQGLLPSSWARVPGKRNVGQRTGRCPRKAKRGGRERDDLSSRLEFLQAELDVKNRELHETQFQNLRLKQRVEQFREIFLAEAGKQQVSDAEVIQLFVPMRQGALSLAKNSALRFDRVPVLETNTPQYFKDFYSNGAWESWKPKDRELHVRRMIFDLLFRLILNRPCFGIEGFPATTNPVRARVAQGLSDFEAGAERKKISTVLLSNWRIATIECVEAMATQERRSDRVAEVLLIFLAPILADQSGSLKEGLRPLALKLCKDAFNLTIMMRKSRDEYRCDAIQDRVRVTTADLASWAEAHAVDQGPDRFAGDQIAYVLFGALTKKSTYDGGIKRVLVKAEVVMERNIWL